MSYMDDFFDNTQLFIPESFDEVRTYAKQIEYLADWCAELEDAIGTDRDYQDIKERVSLLETEYEALSEKLSTDEGVLANHTSEIESIKTQIADIKADIEILQNGKQDKLTAGAGISIVNNVISATGGGGGSTVSVTVGTTTTGEAGTDASVVNSGTAENVVLDFTIPRGATGETGQAGPQGPAGTSPTVTVGTTTTGEAGTDASVVNSGTAENVVLDFTIPRGATGETGQAGPQGPAGTSPTVTVGTTTTGEAGTDASVVNSGTAENVVLDFTIPRGATGETGPAGTSPTVTVGTTTTGEAGTQASVVNSGTAENVVLDFTIPRGATGETGPAGTSPTVTVGTTTTGEAGTQASVVNSGTAENVVLDFTIPKGEAGASITYPDGEPVDSVLIPYSTPQFQTVNPIYENFPNATGALQILSGVASNNNLTLNYFSQTISVNGLQFDTEQRTSSGYTEKIYRWYCPTTYGSNTFPDSIMYIHLTANILGQVRIAKETEPGYTSNYLTLQIGYTKDLSGKAVNIPANTAIRFRIPII